jgi:hypothetical protein
MFILIQPAGGKMSIFHSPYLIFNDPAETLSLNPDQLRGFESESLRLEVRSYEDVSSVISWSREMRQLRSPEIPTETLELGSLLLFSMKWATECVFRKRQSRA